MSSNNLFFSAQDVAKLVSVSVPTAYKMIQQMNDELRVMGYLTISGKVNRRYFESKIFGGLEDVKVDGSL